MSCSPIRTRTQRSGTRTRTRRFSEWGPWNIFSCTRTGTGTSTVGVRIRALVSAALLLSPAILTAQDTEGMVVLRTERPVADVVSRLTAEIATRGLTLFATIDHAANARTVNDSLPPTTVLLFGHPAGGTALMKCERRIAIDLPLKMLVWEDDAGQTRVGYTDPVWLASHHRMPGCGPVIDRTRGLLAGLAQHAVSMNNEQ